MGRLSMVSVHVRQINLEESLRETCCARLLTDTLADLEPFNVIRCKLQHVIEFNKKSGQSWHRAKACEVE